MKASVIKDIALIAGILILGYMYLFKGVNKDSKSRITELENTIILIQEERDSLDVVIASHQQTVDWLVDSVNAKDRQLAQKEDENMRIRRWYDKKIDDLNTYTVGQLDSFFIARYPLAEGESPADSTGLNTPR